MAAYVEMDQVTKTYQMGEVTIKAADGISFQVEKGEFVVVVGPSGAGKTTVLNILGGMDTATTGKVSVDGTRVDKLKGKKLVASFTTGAPEALYHRDGAMGYEIEDFLPPIKATCGLCGMEFSGFVYTGGVSYQSRNDEVQMKEILTKAKKHVGKLVELLEIL